MYRMLYLENNGVGSFGFFNGVDLFCLVLKCKFRLIRGLFK